jgi:hypothetical protein
MRQSCTEALVTEEPDDRIGHVRICGGSGWATAASTRTTCNQNLLAFRFYDSLGLFFSYPTSDSLQVGCAELLSQLLH